MIRRLARRFRIRHALATIATGLALITAGGNLAGGITATVVTLLVLFAVASA